MHPAKNAAATDYAAAVGLAIFPIVYGGTLIGYALAHSPASRYDGLGHVIPDGSAEALGYIVVAILLAFLGHLVTFTAFRWRLCRWPLPVVIPLQLAVSGLCLAALRVLDPPVAVAIAPLVVTAVVYGIAALVVRANRRSLS